ncbi:hypothetical protein LCGC14_2723890, partial [marine sediment metagenome]
QIRRQASRGADQHTCGRGNLLNMPTDLKITHPDYDDTAVVRKKSRDLYEGNDVVKTVGNRERYLYKEKNESDDDYELRVKRAALDPWVEKIINARQALLFAKPITRELPERLAEFEDDVDNRGNNADVFFQEVARESQIDGIRWVLVDMPRLPEGGFASLAAENEAGHRPFFQQIPAANVIDWAVGADGKLLWAVVYEAETEDRSDTWGDAADTTDRWKVWTRQEWIVYEEKTGEDGAKKGDFTEANRQPHGLEVVPLIPFFGTRRTGFSGWPVARTVLDHILQIFNKESDLDWFERFS